MDLSKKQKDLIFDDKGLILKNIKKIKTAPGISPDIDNSVTERTTSGNKLKESELRYRSLIEQATDAICITDASMKFVNINPYALEMFGYTREEALQLYLPDILFTEDLVENPLKTDELRLGKTIRNERRLKRKNGTAVYMEVSTKIMEDGMLIMFGHNITERKQAENTITATSFALQQAVNELNKIMDSSLDIICSIDGEGKFVKLSSAAERILGYKPDELQGRKYIDLVFAGDIEITNIAAAGIMSGMAVTMFENRYICKDGSIVPVIWSATWDEKDKLMYCIAKDATEKKRLEKAFEIERQQFYDMFNEAPTSMGLLKGPDHIFEMANRLYLQLIGKTGIIGKTVKEIMPEIESQGFIALLDEVYKTGETFSANEMLVKINKDSGKEFKEMYLNFLYQAYKNKENKIEGILFFAVDVTEQVLSRKKIEESEIKYRQIVETAQEGIWMIDENNKTIFVNKKMCELLEYNEAEMMGRTNLSFKDAAEQKKALEQIERRKSGQKEIHESKFITKSGKDIWVQTSTNPIFNGDGRYAGALAMMTDITERKRAEQEMTWLINNTEEAFILLNRNLNIISFNSQFHRLYLKYLAVTIVKGDSILDYAQPERRNIVKEIYKRVLNGAEEDGEINIPLPGNSVKTFALKYKPAKDEHGKIIGVFVSAIDVTEKKKSEQKLIVQEKRYRALVENGADGVVIISPEGKLQYASPTVEKILGYTENEILKLDMFAIVHPNDVAAITKVWEQVLASPGVALPGHTGRMLHKNGSWRWLEATVTNMLHDRVLNGIVDNFRDITPKRELENLLHKTNSLARIGSWEVDIVKNTLYWSDITKEIHETGDDFIPDMQTAINYYKEGESRNLIAKKFQAAIEMGLPFDAELQIVTAKGNEKWIRVIGETEFENDKAAKISGSFQDITDRKLADIRLNEMNENIIKHAKELAISNAELEQFAYVASHDLQEPLRMVTSFLTQLEKKYGDVIDAKGKKYIDFAVDGAKRMRQIILDLLEFSRVGRIEDSLENIDLNELVSEIQILFRKKIEEKNAQIIVDVLPQLYASKTPMRQVFQNLISNALKYSRENTTSKIHITVKDLQTHWQFAVSDNGIGIAAEYFHKIFIIFQRLHNKDEFSGTGMGLAVVKKIIENMGGKIWVESEEGKGSTFYFTIKK